LSSTGSALEQLIISIMTKAMSSYSEIGLIFIYISPQNQHKSLTDMYNIFRTLNHIVGQNPKVIFVSPSPLNDKIDSISSLFEQKSIALSNLDFS